MREFVKWDYELRNFAQLEAVMRRAFAVAMAEPRGPVYLSLPREVLAEAHSEFSYSPKGIDAAGDAARAVAARRWPRWRG